MNKFKVEFTESQKYIIDVLAKTEEEAKEISTKHWHAVGKNGTYHYYEDGDTETEITTVFDVTDTDDAFNPMNE